MRRAIGGYVLAGLGVLAGTAWTGSGRGQVNLPPPPPPPLSTNNPPPPPPPANQGGGGGGGSTRPKPRPAEQHTTPPPQQREEPRQPVELDDYAPRRLSIRLNPLPIFVSRLSVDVEYQLAPHHALVAAPHITFRDDDRGKLVSYAFGYPSTLSTGVGTELGYHYWLAPRMEGLFLGPSLLVGFTGHPLLKNFAYYGAAFDVGYQLMLSNGFTLAAGGGVLLVGAGAGHDLHVTPRFLLGIGWTF